MDDEALQQALLRRHGTRWVLERVAEHLRAEEERKALAESMASETETISAAQWAKEWAKEIAGDKSQKPIDASTFYRRAKAAGLHGPQPRSVWREIGRGKR